MKRENHNLSHHQSGIALVIVLSLSAALLLLILTYSFITLNNVKTSSNSKVAATGIFAAEAGLNSRVELIRKKFIGYQTPIGDSPKTTNGLVACQGGNNGTLDMACDTFSISGRQVTTYTVKGVTENKTIPSGEDFAGLNAEETAFTVYSQSLNTRNNPDAIASLAFKSRLVPLFQFAVFFANDLEFDNTATLSLTGPVHTNSNLFLDGQLTISGPNSRVTAAHDIFRGLKQNNTGCNATVLIGNDADNTIASNLKTLNCNSRQAYTNTALKSTFGSKVKGSLGELSIPSVQDLQPVPGSGYWDRADVRILVTQVSSDITNDASWSIHFVKADKSPVGVSITNSDSAICNFSNNTDPAPTQTATNISTILNTSGTPLGFSNPIGRAPTGTSTIPPTLGALRTFTTHANFVDNREAVKWMGTPDRMAKRLVDIDVSRLLACVQANSSIFGLTDGIADKTDGGLVIYLTFDDSNYGNLSQETGANTLNNYGFRLHHGERLASSNAADPAIKGLTFASDQAVYIMGNYNTPATLAAGWKPSSIVSDSVNVLSEGWSNINTTTTDNNGVSRPANPGETCKLYGTDGSLYIASRKYAGTLQTGRDPRFNAQLKNTYGSNVSSSGQRTMVTPGWYVAGHQMGYANVQDTQRQNWYLYPASTSYSTANNGANAPETYWNDAKSRVPLFCRPAGTRSGTSGIQQTTVRAAILAGTALTGNQNLQVWDNGVQPTSGGVHNMMRFHEDWRSDNSNTYAGTSQKTFIYSGSLVSLSTPLHADGPFRLGGPGYIYSGYYGTTHSFNDYFPWIGNSPYTFGDNSSTNYGIYLGNYLPPKRDWGFDEKFSISDNLPPLTPRFVYVKQENFVRKFEQ